MSEIFALFVLLLLSGFFSGSETALTSLSGGRAKALAKDGRSGGAALWRLKQNVTRTLITLLIGNNLVNNAATALATVIAAERLGRLGPGLAVVVLTVLLVVFGEVTPKSLATRQSERVSLLAAPVIVLLGRVFAPLVWALERFTVWFHRTARLRPEPTVTEPELISLLEHGTQEGTIEQRERELIERVFAFSDLQVEDVMTPRSSVFCMAAAADLRSNLPALLACPHSRIPLYWDSPDDVRRVLYLRDVLTAVAGEKQDITLGELSRKTLFVPERQRLEPVAALMRNRQVHLAMVVDEYGGFQGVVSMEDLLEELVGEIYDETDAQHDSVRALTDGTFMVEGSTELRALQEGLGLEEAPGKPTDTLNRWLLNHLQRIPDQGEQIELQGLQILVERATHRRIHRLRVRVLPPPADPEPAADS